MTDLRATERLLEVIEEQVIRIDELDRNDMMIHNEVGEIQVAIMELRRRGDTLVRAADLDYAVRKLKQDYHTTDGLRILERLESILGGKPPIDKEAK